jgi:cyanophycinase-like exopeptidase
MLDITLLALATLLPARIRPPQDATPQRAGAVALLGESFELSEETCRELAASAPAGERIWITPASASAAAEVDPLVRMGPPAQIARLDASEAHAGDDAELCQRVRGAGTVVLTGGSYLEWYALFRPSEKASGLHAALLAAHKSGALVVGSGAAAAFLAEWTVVDRAALHRVLRNPRDASEHLIVRGIGLVRGLVDASAAPRGSVARLLKLAEHQRPDVALYLDGRVAWIERSRGLAATVRGSGSAFVLDFRPARRERARLFDARLALLLDGDRWSAHERSIAGDLAPFAPADATPGAVRSAELGRSAELRRSAEREPDAAWLRDVLAREIAPDRALRVEAQGGGLSIALHADERSLFGAGRGSCARIAFDLAWSDR